MIDQSTLTKALEACVLQSRRVVKEGGDDDRLHLIDQIASTALALSKPAGPRASKRRQSRPQRWADACAEAREAHGKLDAVFGELEEAMSTLADIKSEYEEWKDNLPENLQQSALGEKLEAVCDLDLDQDWRSASVDDIDSLLSEVEAADLPRGFGKD